MALSKLGKKILIGTFVTLGVLGVIALIVCASLGLFSPSSSGGKGNAPSGGKGNAPSGGNMTSPSGGNTTSPSGGNMTSPSGGNTTSPSGGNTTSPSGGNTTSPSGGNTTSPSGGGGGGGSGDWYNIYNTDGDGTNSYGYATLLENYKNDGTLATIDGTTTLGTSDVDPDVRENFVDLLQTKTRTGLWLDTYDSIDRLEAALEQGGFTKIIFLFYDLPNRDCAASSSNGQLCCTYFLNGAEFCDALTMQSFAGDAKPNPSYCLGLNDDVSQVAPATAAAPTGITHTYTEYADKVVSIMADYQNIEFHIIVEPDSWPNVITNSGLGENRNIGKKNCSLNTAALSYCAGIDYALRRLTGQIRDPNSLEIVPDTSDEGTTIYNMWKSGKIHTYLDIAHNAWMGWDLLTDANKGIMESLLKGIDKGINSDTGASAYQQIGNTTNWNNNSSANGGTPQADIVNVYTIDKFYWDTKDWCPHLLSGFTMNVSNYNPLGKMAPWDQTFGSGTVLDSSDGAGDGLGSNVLKNYCGWEPPDDINAVNGATATGVLKPACVQPCNAVVNYNFVNNLLNYAGLMGAIYKGVFDEAHGTVWNGETYPSILIDTARNGGSEEVYTANYRAMVAEKTKAEDKDANIPEPCASWCNVASTSLGQPSFGSNGEILHPSDVTGKQIPFISFASLKPPGESDGCVTSPLSDAPDFGSEEPGQLLTDGTQKGNPQITSGAFLPGSACTTTALTAGGENSSGSSTCARFDTMCGHQFAGGYGARVEGPNVQPNNASPDNPGTIVPDSNITYTDQTKTYMMNCPPEAGVWDMYQIDMLASNFPTFTDTGSQGGQMYATSNNDSFWTE